MYLYPEGGYRETRKRRVIDLGESGASMRSLSIVFGSAWKASHAYAFIQATRLRN